MRFLLSQLAVMHCRLFHRAIMPPIWGKYRCRTCLRQFPVSW